MSGFLPESTVLKAAAAGDAAAREELWLLLYPCLLRIAHGKLPPHVRRLEETEDVVQMAVMRALSKVPEFSDKEVPQFFAYLRTIVINVLRTEIGRHGRRRSVALVDATSDEATPPEVLEDAEVDRAYEEALVALRDENPRLYVAQVLRTDLGLGHAEIARLLGKGTDAARRDVARARTFLAACTERKL